MFQKYVTLCPQCQIKAASRSLMEKGGLLAGSHRARPVLPLNVSELVHDQSITVLVDSWTLKAGVRRLGDFGSLTTWTTQLL